MQTIDTAKAIYERMENDRKPYVSRAVDCAKYTIPSLFPEDSATGSTKFDTPKQSIGARGINNLSSKMLLALMPPNSPFFRLSPSEDVLTSLEQKPEVKASIEQELMKLEQRIQRYIETRQIRVTVKEALNQLIVAGNCLLFMPPKEGGMKLYRLSNYTVKRDALGTVITIVALDKLTVASLPKEIQSMAATGKEIKPEEEVSIYTHIYLEGSQYITYQEINGKRIPGTDNTYPSDKSPWIALRLVKMDGESYGRSYVEEYLGDLISLEQTRAALLDYSAIASFILYLVNPSGITQPRKLAKCNSGDFAPGRIDDIGVLQLDKSKDMQVTKSTHDTLAADLSYVFMLNSAVQRNGERVTAEEIRYVAGELEDTLGGTYSILSQELQLPIVRRLILQLQATGNFPQMPDGLVEPSITTGLEALGRGHDLNKLQMFQQFMVEVPGAAEMVDMSGLVLMYATSLGLDTTGLIKTPEQIAQEQQQAMMQQAMQQATPAMAQGLVDANMPQQAQQQ